MSLAAPQLIAPPASFAASPRHSADPDSALVRKVTAAARGAVVVRRDPETQRVSFLQVGRGGDLFPAVSPGKGNGKVEAAVNAFAELNGVEAASLDALSSVEARGVAGHRFTQSYGGLPVWGTRVNVTEASNGAIESVNGYAVPTQALSGLPTVPRVSRTDAIDRMINQVIEDPPADSAGRRSHGLSALKVSGLEQVIYPVGAVRHEPGSPVLAWHGLVSNGSNVAEEVFLDATTGRMVNRFTSRRSALQRQLSTPDGLWTEGDAFPGALNSEDAGVLSTTSEVYWLFNNAWGRDSYVSGLPMLMSRLPSGDATCPNAYWDGTRLNYCPGLGSDDVIAHEWAHAYTERTVNLAYQWQTGALDEAYADIWGETVDLINGRDDAEEGDIKAHRQADQCSTRSARVPVLTVDSPTNVQVSCFVGVETFGADLSAAGISGEVVAAIDEDEDGAQVTHTTEDGCSAFSNQAAVASKFAMVVAGGCTNLIKAQNAAAAGAIGLLVRTWDDYVQLAPTDPAAVPIPTVVMPKLDGNAIADALALGPVRVTAKLTGGATRTASTRWVVGEDTSGGGLRDLWRPSCNGNPGSVTDAEYWCSAADNGGVHMNSTIVSHAYALLVDGGSEDAITVPSIGMDKAAAIFYPAQLLYLTPVSDFRDEADALEAGCAALTGHPVSRLSTSPGGLAGTGPTVLASDCAAVTAAIAAVGLRKSPTKCGFKPQLSPAGDSPCGPGYTSSTSYEETFDAGLGEWTTTSTARYWGNANYPWTNVSGPDGHGPAAYAYGKSAGNCSGGTGDATGTSTLVSPVLYAPTAAQGARLTFDHYVDTDSGYDGGLVQWRPLGGSWQAVPKTAYAINAPERSLSSSLLNSNPLAGSNAFTGHDQGSLSGSWGRSEISLTDAGIHEGQAFQVAFVFGRDGCLGADGWYVDNVRIVECREKVKLSAQISPSPIPFGGRGTIRVSATGLATGLPAQGFLEIESPEIFGSTFAQSLSDGTGLVDVVAPTRPGTYPISVGYVPAIGLPMQNVQVINLLVGKRASAMRVIKEARVGKPNSAWMVRVKVKPIGTDLPLADRTGKVRVLYKGKVIAKTRLSFGSARFELPKKLKGTHTTYTLKFSGDRYLLPTTVKVRVR